MGRSNDMSDWLIRLKQKDHTPQFEKKSQIRSDIAISSNSTLQCKAAFIMYNPGGGGRFLLISYENFKPLQTNC